MLRPRPSKEGNRMGALTKMENTRLSPEINDENISSCIILRNSVITNQISSFMVIFALLLPVPQLYVVTLERSSRVCEQPLLDLAIASIVLTFFTIAFSVLFSILIPVPRELKIAFHVYGVACLIVGLIQVVYTFKAKEDCSVSTPELVYLSLASSMFSVVCTVFLGLMFPFWVLNKVKTDVVLDPYSRAGMCYEPTKCCSCLWHI